MGEIRAIFGVTALALGLALLFFVINIILAQARPAPIYFYAALKELGLFALFSFLILLFARRRLGLDAARIAFAEIIFVLFAYSVIITFPVTIDRSFSVYMLGSLDAARKEKREITTRELSDIVQAYFFDRRLIQKRLDEQLATGSLEIDPSGRVTLTGKGELIARANRLVGRIFNLDERNADPAPPAPQAGERAPAQGAGKDG